MKSLFLLNILAAAHVASGAYVVQDDYTAEKFFDMFDLDTEADPTNGTGKALWQTEKPKLTPHSQLNTSILIQQRTLA
jgi:hypothetical protein